MRELFPEGVALVVGGSGGVGQSIALKLAEQGCDVAVTYRSKESAAQAVVAQIDWSVLKPLLESRRARPLLGVEVDGVTLRHAKLPFGLATSPRLFVEALQRTMSKVALPEGTTAICYVDDIAVVSTTPAGCVEAAVAVVRRLIDDGWRVACGKSFLRPAEDFLFLGLHLDIPAKAAALTEPRQRRLIEDIDAIGRERPGWRMALQKVMGVLAWAAPAVRGAGFLAPPCYRALRTGALDGEARDALDMLTKIVLQATNPQPLTPPSRLIDLVTDAGDAWCAALVEAGVVKAVHRGELSEEARSWSSTAREAVALAEAVRAFALPVLSDVGVHVTTDSAALAAIVNRGRTRSVGVSAAFADIVDWARQGLRLSASWVRRSEGLQPMVDAGTAPAASGRWFPAPGLTTWLRTQAYIDLHIGGGDRERSIGRLYTADIQDQARADFIRRARPGWRSGWVGVGTDVNVAGLTVLIHPRWGTERSAVARLRAAGCVLLLSGEASGAATAFQGWGGTVSIVRPPPALRWWQALSCP